jgi:TRAP-type uncharacterized transport system substrate-binding protein
MAESTLTAPAIRSRLVLEIASELVAGKDRTIRVAEVSLRDLASEQPLQLSSLSTIGAMADVAEGRLDMAIANPSAALTLASLGRGPFKQALPLRTIAVIPSRDQYVFAVKKEFGITRFEDIGTRRLPLRVLLRGVPDHFLHTMLDDIAEASGFAAKDIEGWGGELRKVGPHPLPGDEKFAAVARGEADAMFDEGAHGWVNAAAEAEMTILTLSDATMGKLEAMGYRRTVLGKNWYPALPHDVQTVDFSGWPIFVRENLSDERVTQICAALEARKDRIAWQQPGPLPLDRMVSDTPDAPMGVPLHRAAEHFWREQGYLPHSAEVRDVNPHPWPQHYQGIPIRFAIPVGNGERCVVLLDNEAIPALFNNLLCIDRSGKTVWTAKPATSTDSFVGVTRTSNGLFAWSWEAFRFRLDEETGAELDREFVK